MSLSLAQLRAGILSATSTDINDWSNGNTDLDLFINKAWWDIMDRFEFREKEGGPITFSTVVGTRSYDLTTILSPVILECIQNFSIEDPDTGAHTILNPISEFTYESEYVNETTSEDTPTDYFRRGSLVYLFPTPDKIYTINIYHQSVLSDIGTNGPVIPQSWHEIIEYGAKIRALLDKQDFDKAANLSEFFNGLIESRTPVKVKELKNDSKVSGVEVPGRDY